MVFHQCPFPFPPQAEFPSLRRPLRPMVFVWTVLLVSCFMFFSLSPNVACPFSESFVAFYGSQFFFPNFFADTLPRSIQHEAPSLLLKLPGEKRPWPFCAAYPNSSLTSGQELDFPPPYSDGFSPLGQDCCF